MFEIRVFGQTEVHGHVSQTRPDDPPEIVTTSCGRPIPGIELKIVDEAGKTLPAGEAGEVMIRERMSWIRPNISSSGDQALSSTP